MKNVFVVISLFISLLGFAQEKKYKIGDIITFRSSVKVTTNGTVDGIYSLSENVKDEKVIYQVSNLSLLESNLFYMINDSVGDHYIIEALPFKVYTNCRIKRRNKIYGFFNHKEIDKSIRSKLYNDKLFKITKDEFDKKVAEPIKGRERFNIGLLTLPFKYRPDGNKTFNTEFNLSSTLNTRLNSFYTTDFYLQLGAGIGSVGLSSANASNIKENSSVDVAILTGLVGFMLQYDKVQAGVYVGWDYINNQKYYVWESHGHMWLGFGVGYELFKVSVSDTKTKQKK